MNPVKGWYDDPASPGQLRWWDGERWTELTREQAPSAPAASDPPATAGSQSGDLGAPHVDEPLFPETTILRPPDDETSDVAPDEVPGVTSSIGGTEGSGVYDAVLGGVGGRRPDAPPLPPLPAGGGETLVTLPGGPGEGLRGRRGPVLATAALVAVVGVVAAVAFSGFGAGNIFDLAVGECFDDEVDATPDVREIHDVPVVDCELPHENEVFASYLVDLPEFPGGATLGQQAVDGCVGRFRDVVGFPLELTDLDVSAFWPTQTSWDQGDREVLCFLFRLDRAKLVGSRIGLAQGEDLGVFQLEVGDCFVAPLRDAAPGTEVEGVAAIDCGLPHHAEVIASFTLPAGPHPGADELARTSQVRCLEAFEPAIGQPYADSVLVIHALPPTESSWDGGDRNVLCYVSDPVNGDITGPARAWALAQREDVLSFGQGVDVSELLVGGCFDDPVAARVEVVPCQDPHDNEAFHVADAPQASWPGPDAMEEYGDEVCGPAFVDWVGPDRTDLLWIAFRPSEATWAEGDRRILCALYDVDLAKLVGSQKRAAV